MSYPGMPTTTDLANLLTDCGITPPSAATQYNALQSAVDRWERETRYQPFLSDGSTSTSVYTPPGPEQGGGWWLGLQGGQRKLFLRKGLISLGSLTVNGTPYTVSQSFYLRPDGAPEKGKPYEYVEFTVPIWGRFQSLAITGVWGYSLTVPAKAWQAVLAGAALELMPTVTAAKSRGRARHTEGEESDTYAIGKDAGAYAFEIGQWQRQWDEGLAKFRRPRL